MILADGLDEGQDLLAVRRQPRASAAALEQLDAPLALEVGDHAAHARLAVVELAGSGADAAGADALDERLVFLDCRVHDAPSRAH